MSTLGDALDRALGGPDHFVCANCRGGLHQVCLGYGSGRTCECAAEAAHPLRDRPPPGQPDHGRRGD